MEEYIEWQREVNYFVAHENGYQEGYNKGWKDKGSAVSEDVEKQIKQIKKDWNRLTESYQNEHPDFPVTTERGDNG